jgi:hypothetical protein
MACAGVMQDVAGEVVMATRPLLRQIEQLQEQQAEQQEQWERLEMALARQVDDAHAKACGLDCIVCTA